jgi:hypothetical protein
MTLIEELYSSNAVDLIRDLYKDDLSAKESFYEAFGNKILQSSEKVLLSKPLDILMLICSTAKFASSKDESSQVAVIVYKRIKEPNPLPYVLDDRGMDLAEKSLVALSFFKPALMARWKKGGPHPDFYRSYSKRAFDSSGYYDVAEHHEQWENFFSEFFI